MICRRHLALTLVTLIAASLVACASASTPTPSPTPAFASEEEAFAAAEKTYRAYIDLVNAVDLTDPDTFEPVFDLSTGSTHKADRENLSRMSAENQTIRGVAVVLRFRGIPSRQESGDVRAIACLDVSDVSIADADGTSVVNPERPDIYAIEIVFVERGDELRIDSTTRSEDASCAAP